MSAVLIVPPLLVEIGSDLKVSVPVAGQLATATFAAWAASLLCVGPLSDSFGRRPVALAGLAILAVSALASAFAPNIEILLALRALTGLAGGTLPPTAVGVLSDVISPARRAQAITAMLAIQGVVAGVTVPMVAVLADLGGWRLPFVVVGALLAAALLANLVWFPKDNRQRSRSFAFVSRYVSLLSLRYFRVAIAVGATQRISFWATLSFFPAHLLLAYDVPLALVACRWRSPPWGRSWAAIRRRMWRTINIVLHCWRVLQSRVAFARACSSRFIWGSGWPWRWSQLAPGS